MPPAALDAPLNAPLNASVSRRVLLLAASATIATGVAACAGSTPNRRGTSADTPATPQDQFAALERAYSARLGVYALDTATGTTLRYRADERFPMCSTYKVLAVAAFLRQATPATLARTVTYSQADLVPPDPVTASHVATGLTWRQLCQAAIEQSDNTAANLVVAGLGGPRAVTGYARRQLGDQVTRLDRTEPTLNQATPGDPRDTSTPEAIATDYAQILTMSVLTMRGRLTGASQELLISWLIHATTGTARIRPVVPSAWTVAAKSGTGGHGTDNDVAVIWRPGNTQPVVLAVMSTQAAAPQGNLVTRTAGIALSHVTGGSAK
jgi:beta-lactamase class A